MAIQSITWTLGTDQQGPKRSKLDLRNEVGVLILREPSEVSLFLIQGPP